MNLTPEGFRTATYLATQARMDLRRGKGPKCNPPNRQCGDRCIPPNWKCRARGEGTDSHSRVVAGDPLAGAASIARGRARLAKGLKTGSLVDIQGGRAAIARGIVKAVPGQNLQQKQGLRKRVEGAILPVATGLFVAWAVRQGHEGAKILFPAYAKGPARDIEDAANNAIGFVFDRIPIYGNLRQAQRRNAAVQAQVLGRSVSVGINRNPDIAANASKDYIELSRQKVSGLRDVINKSLDEPGSDGKPPDYATFRSRLLSNVVAAQADGKSVYSEPAAINFMAKKYGIEQTRLIGADNTAKKSELISRVAARLSDAAESMRKDMAVRGLDFRKPADVDRYAAQASTSAANRFRGLSESQQKEAFGQLSGTIRQLVSPSISPNTYRNIAAREFKDTRSTYEEYFKQTARRIVEDTSPTLRVQVAASTESPVKSVLIATAERVKSKVGITAPISGANHAELVLQKVYYERALTGNYSKNRKSTWLPQSDTDIKYAAQDLGWDNTGGISAAYGVIRRSGQFPNIAPRPVDRPTPPPTSPSAPSQPKAKRRARGHSPAARIADMMRQKNPDGTPRYATREAAEAALKRMLKRDDALPPGIASGADIRYAAMDIGWRGTGGAQDAWEFLQGTGQFNGLVRPTTGTPRARRSRGRRDRTDVNEDKSEAHHAAYMATRLDLKATSTGQKCGNSYIPKSYKCRRGTAASIPSKAPTNKTEAKLKSSFNTKLLIGGTALVGLSALAAAGIDDVVRTRSRQFGEPTFKTFAETIGEPGKFNAATKKRLSAGAFGETSLVQLDGKTYVVKNPKMPSKEMRRAMSTGIDDKATKNLYRAQGRMTHSEVSNARLAAEIGVAPKVIAANKNTLVTEVAKGEPAKKITRDNREQLHTTLAKLHRAGIAHNDLKPDNFFVDKESGSIQLIDFGLSMRSSSGVAREWYRAMNPESPNPFIRITGTATGSFNLRELNPKGYERAETALRQVIKGEVNEDNIISAGKDPKIARQMQLVINNYYLGRYNYASLTESRRNGRR